MTYTVLFLYSVTRNWLALSPEERETFNETTLEPLLAKYAGWVRARLFDAEAFTARYSDFAMFETGDLKDFFLEELRDTAFYTVPFLEVGNLIVGTVGNFHTFQAVQEIER